MVANLFELLLNLQIMNNFYKYNIILLLLL